MDDLACDCLRLRGGSLELLDQRLLPGCEQWLPCPDIDSVIAAIQGLAVRGAPAIGVSAALALGCLAERGVDLARFREQAARLRAARPTAVNLMHLVDRLLARADQDQGLAAIPALARAAFDEDVALCEAMADHGAALIADGMRVLTHCNTGGLATVGLGTALGVIRRAHSLGRAVQVWVDETRPLLQGARLTAWELGRAGIPYRLISDSMAASLMAAGQVDQVWVGADRIAANGDAANKIGTYSLAVLAHHHGIPFHVVAPSTTLDLACADGHAIPIEERDPAEVRGFAGSAGALAWAPAGCPVYNPAFDVTPAALIDAWVLESGVYTREQVAAGALAGRPTPLG